MSAMTPGRWRRAAGRETGSASVEFTAVLPYLLLAAAFAWQLLLTASVVTAAENAARTGSRVQALGRDGDVAAVEALSPWMRDQAEADVGPSGGCDDDDGTDGTRVTVCIGVPVLWPGVSFPEFTVVRDAELPPSL
jgi:Flp pilus assembly protein TadG